MKDTFTKGKMIVFSSMTVSVGIGAILLGWVTFFATDYLGLSAAKVGLLFMISKIFDGFTDLVAGYIIDKSHSRLGKGRPYEFAQIGYWVCLVLMFVVPIMNEGLTYAWIFIMYTLANSVFLTLLNCSNPVYMANVIDRPEQTLTANAIIGVISMIASTLGGMIIPQLVATVGQTRLGWSVIAIGMGAIALVIGMLRFFIVKEKEGRNATTEIFTIKDTFNVITHNKYILIFSLVIFISNIGYNLTYGATNYYCTYVLGDVGLVSFMSLTMLSSVISLVITPIVAKKIGLTKFMRILSIISVVASLLRLINPYSLVLVFVTGFFCTIAFLTVWLYMNTFIIDCIDYGEWSTGIRSEGSITCVQSVFAKVGTAIGAGLIGVLMGISGYNGVLEVQPDSAINMLIIMYAIVPAVFALLQYIVLRFYNLDEKLPQIRKELAERN